MILIGIDPGEHTGLAVWDTSAREFVTIETLQLHQALAFVKEMHDYSGSDLGVIFEDARLRKWIPREKSMSEYRGRLMGAGSVKRDSTIWEEFLKDHKIPYRAIAPRAGATKWNADYFARVTGYRGKTSEHGRDAALKVFQMKTLDY